MKIGISGTPDEEKEEDKESHHSCHNHGDPVKVVESDEDKKYNMIVNKYF